jgi:hypothetical protein
MCNRTKFYDTIADFPEVGVISRLYVAKDTGDIYVWDGANYITSDNSIISINSTQNVPYTGVELPADDGVTVGDTSAVQFNDGTIVFYTWDGNTWVVDFVDNASISGAGVANKVAFWTDANTLDSDTNLHWDDVNKRLGVGTASPTHPLTIGATDFITGSGKGFVGYTTADQTTNYQRLVISGTSGNIASYNLEKSGTGVFGYHSWQVGGTPIMEIDAAQAIIFGNLLIGPDNTKTLGRLSGSPLRFKDVYIGTGLQVGAAANTSIAATAHFVGAGSTSATYGLQIHNSTGTNNALVVRDDGNVGIGTTSPVNALDVRSSAGGNIISLGGGIPTMHLGFEPVGGISFIDAVNTNILKFKSGGVDSMTILNNGNVGIGTTSPSTKLHVLSADNTTAATIAIDATQANVTASDVFVAFTSTSGTEGSIAGTAVAGVIAYNTFTGSHYSQSNDIEQKPIKVISYQKSREYKETIKEEGTWEDGVFKEGEVIFEDTVGEEVITEVEVDAYDTTLIPGTVLCSTNEMCEWQGEDNATLPKCRVSDSPMDKAVYGVYGGHDRDGDIFVLGIGTGVALVNEEGGKIEIGDFLCTSSTPGQAMRYDGNDMRVVLAKARENFEGESRAIAVTLLAG